MWHAMFLYFAPLALSIAFIVFGYRIFFGLIPDPKSLLEARRRPTPGMGFGLLLVGSLVLIAITCFSPFPWTRIKLINQALHTPSHSIVRIELLPAERDSLVQAPIEITESELIRQITEELGEAKSISPNHHQDAWKVNVRITSVKGVATFVVTRTRDSNSGTLLGIGSREFNGGWNLGDFRADGLAPVLERIAADKQ